MKKKIKLLIAPYKIYNQFLPSIVIGLISQHLHENNIPHDKDDMDVKLHHMQKDGKIDLDNIKNEIDEWDAYINGAQNEKVEKKIEKIAGLTDFKGYEVLLFSTTPSPGCDIPDYVIPMALFRFLKTRYNPIIITNNPQMKGDNLDIVDEIIESIPDLFHYLKNNLNMDIKQPDKSLTKQNLEGLPLDMYRYQGVLMAGYFFYDGCLYNCYFCDRYFEQRHKNEGKTVALPEPKLIVSEIAEFVEKYNIKNLMFLNTTINPTKKFAMDIAGNIIKSKLDIMWCDCANFRGMDYELLDSLKKSGCVKLVFGLETASKRLQKRMNKEIDIEHAEKIIKYCYEIGIWVDITLMCGLPYETHKDIYDTLLFIRKNYIYLRGINLNRFMMKLNEFYYNPKKHGLVFKKVDNDYTIYGFDEINGMKWDDKWKYTEEVYRDILSAIDPLRVDYLRPVHHVFRVFSNKIPVSKINDYLNSHVLNNDTRKLDLLIQKYKSLL